MSDDAVHFAIGRLMQAVQVGEIQFTGFVSNVILNQLFENYVNDTLDGLTVELTVTLVDNKVTTTELYSAFHSYCDDSGSDESEEEEVAAAAASPAKSASRAASDSEEEGKLTPVLAKTARASIQVRTVRILSCFKNQQVRKNNCFLNRSFWYVSDDFRMFS